MPLPVPLRPLSPSISVRTEQVSGEAHSDSAEPPAIHRGSRDDDGAVVPGPTPAEPFADAAATSACSSESESPSAASSVCCSYSSPLLVVMLVAVWFAASTAAAFFLQSMLLAGREAQGDDSRAADPDADAATTTVVPASWLFPAVVALLLQATVSAALEWMLLAWRVRQSGGRALRLLATLRVLLLVDDDGTAAGVLSWTGVMHTAGTNTHQSELDAGGPPPRPCRAVRLDSSLLVRPLAVLTSLISLCLDIDVWTVVDRALCCVQAPSR